MLIKVGIWLVDVSADLDWDNYAPILASIKDSGGKFKKKNLAWWDCESEHAKMWRLKFIFRNWLGKVEFVKSQIFVLYSKAWTFLYPFILC